MKLMHLIMKGLQRSLFSFRFILCVLGVSGIMFAAVVGLLGNPSSAWYLVDRSLAGSGMASTVLCILPGFTFAISFASEWEEKAVNYWIIRAGILRYTVYKIIVSAISGFLTIAVGMLLFIVILMLRYPLFINVHTYYSYESLMEQGHVFIGITLFIIHFALSGALTAVCAIWVSVYMPNRYVAAAAPVVIHFTLLRITNRLGLPGYLNPLNWIEGIYSVESPINTLMIKLAIVFMLCFIMGIAAATQMKRRINHA